MTTTTISPKRSRARLGRIGLIALAALVIATAARAECEPSRELCDPPGHIGQNAVDQMKSLRDRMPPGMRNMLDKAIDDAQDAVNQNSDPAESNDDNSASGDGTAGTNASGGDDGRSSNSDN